MWVKKDEYKHVNQFLPSFFYIFVSFLQEEHIYERYRILANRDVFSKPLCQVTSYNRIDTTFLWDKQETKNDSL